MGDVCRLAVCTDPPPHLSRGGSAEQRARIKGVAALTPLRHGFERSMTDTDNNAAIRHPDTSPTYAAHPFAPN